jgi:hypothetical protein
MLKENRGIEIDLAGREEHVHQITTMRKLTSVDTKNERMRNLLVGFRGWPLRVKMKKITKEVLMTSLASETVLGIS